MVTSTDFIATQLLLEKNKDKGYRATKGDKKQAILSGLIKCKYCGSYMRPRNMTVYKEGGKTISYRYYCSLKEKSRGHKCQSPTVVGNKLDNEIINIIRNTFVPNSEIYKELKKMTVTRKKEDINEELEYLENEYKKNNEELENLIEKLKFIDTDLIDMVNSKLRKLKSRKLELEENINKIKTKNKNYDTIAERNTAKGILEIIDNSFKIFEKFDLKTKKDIVGLFIESVYGEGEEIEINFLNCKIDENIKKLLIPTALNKVDFFDNQTMLTEAVGKVALTK